MRNLLELERFNEIFQNFEYKMPDDPELMLYDFYFMSVIAAHVDLPNEPEAELVIKQSVEKLVNEMYSHMSKALKWSLSCEIRHIFDSSFRPESKESKEMFEKYPNFSVEFYKALIRLKTSQSLPSYLADIKARDIEEFTDELGNRFEQDPMVYKGNNSEREKANRAIKMVQRQLNISNLKLAQIYMDFYYGGYWGSHQTSYGGPKWGDIAKGWYKLLQAKTLQQKIIWIDHAYDLQHNTSTVFNKIQGYVKSSGYGWIFKALEWKKWIDDPRQFYYKVSPQLKRLVAYISKNNYGLAMDSFTGAEKPKISPSVGDPIIPSPSSIFVTENPLPEVLGEIPSSEKSLFSSGSAKWKIVSPNALIELGLISDSKVYLTSYLANQIKGSGGVSSSHLVDKIRELFKMYFIKSFVILGTQDGSKLSVKDGHIQKKFPLTSEQITYQTLNIKFYNDVKVDDAAGEFSGSSTPEAPSTVSVPNNGSSNDPSGGQGIPYYGNNSLKLNQLYNWGLDDTSIDWINQNVWISQALLTLAKDKYTKIKWIFGLNLENVYIHYNRNTDEAEVIGLGTEKSSVSGWWKKGNLIKSSFEGTWKNGDFVQSKFLSGEWINGFFSPNSIWVSGSWKKGYHSLLGKELNHVKFNPPDSSSSQINTQSSPSSTSTSTNETDYQNGEWEGLEAENALKVLFDDINIKTSSDTKISVNDGIVYWENGTWFGGTWFGGTWENGTWFGGYWFDGTWEDGTWNGGNWEDGTWKGGTWESGIWKGGTWVNGVWNGGVWYGGTWNIGTWESGVWKGGVWKNGTWKDGIWKGGTWEFGTWEEGVWKGGTWEDGTWEEGVWENGAWNGGTWNGGTWQGGLWNGGPWTGGVSNESVNKELVKNKDNDKLYLKENSIETHLRVRKGWY